MNTNKIFRAVALFAGLTSASLLANAVKIENTDYDGVIPNGSSEYGSGGEFLATISKDNNFTTLADNFSFLTFCLERGVTVGLGKTYTYTIETDAKRPSAPDRLSVGSAWLYENFFWGNLSSAAPGVSYFDPLARDSNAGELQRAFWMLEDEITLDVNNFYVKRAIIHFGSQALAQDGITDKSKVKVLNIWGSQGEDIQSMLVYVPDSGMTALLLGLGLLSLAAIRRKV